MRSLIAHIGTARRAPASLGAKSAPMHRLTIAPIPCRATLATTATPGEQKHTENALDAAPEKLFKVQLYRSTIGLHKHTRAIAQSLGLKKKGTIRFLPVRPNIVGELVHLKEIVRVELVNSRELPQRKPVLGYSVEKKYTGSPYLDL
ncbi:hypothetical protein H4R34_005560 [Dimargaris verticillata]|uniref:Large ribosomal subunit protein uL30-like ferredoxin-like fold domain-containing protein n=1 Tax=Dimargaris verticillata TaxID=2761393 RepID=A0A9W8B2P7_9FUNG|nr:hypothetical protein H4R34_005560 [Dimargaris verticillata]